MVVTDGRPVWWETRAAAALDGKFHGLSDEETTLFEDELELLPSPCRRPHSLRHSFLVDRDCRLAPRALAFLVQLVSAGHLREAIWHRYRDRYHCPRENLDLRAAMARGTSRPWVTVVEFMDFKCKMCKALHPVLSDLFRDIRYLSSVRLVILHIPRPDPVRRQAAIAALAASRQGKYWPYHDRLLHTDELLGQEVFLRYAREMGLDLTRFQRDSSWARTRLDREIAMAQTHEPPIEDTPTLFINGCRVVDLSSFKEQLDEELSRFF